MLPTGIGRGYYWQGVLQDEMLLAYLRVAKVSGNGDFDSAPT